MWMWLPWLEMKQLRTVGPFPFRVSASASLVGHVHQIWDSKQLFAVAFPAKLLHWKSYLAGLPPFYGKGMGWMEHFNRTRPNLMLKTMGFQSIFHPFWWDSQAPGLCRGRRHLRHRSLCCAWHPGPTGLVWGDAWQDLPRGVFYRFFLVLVVISPSNTWSILVPTQNGDQFDQQNMQQKVDTFHGMGCSS